MASSSASAPNPSPSGNTIPCGCSGVPDRSLCCWWSARHSRSDWISWLFTLRIELEGEAADKLNFASRSSRFLFMEDVQLYQNDWWCAGAGGSAGHSTAPLVFMLQPRRAVNRRNASTDQPESVEEGSLAVDTLIFPCKSSHIPSTKAKYVSTNTLVRRTRVGLARQF